MLWVTSLIFLYKRYSIISQSRNKPYQSYNDVKKSLDSKRLNSMAPTHIIIETNEDNKSGAEKTTLTENNTESTSLHQVNVNTGSKFLLQNTHPTLTTDNSLDVNTNYNSYSESFASSSHSHINKKLFSASKNHHILRSLDENHLSYSINDSFLNQPTNLQALANSAPNSSNQLPESRHWNTEQENRYNLFDVSLNALHQYQQRKQKMRQKTFRLFKAKSQCQSNPRSQQFGNEMSTVSLKYNPSTNQVTSSFSRKQSTPLVRSFHSQPMKSSSYLSIPQNKVTRQINPASSMKRKMFVNSRNSKFFAQTTNNELTSSNANKLANEDLVGTIEERSEHDDSVDHFLKPSSIPQVVRDAFMDLHRRSTISKSDSNIRKRKSPSPVSIEMHKYSSCKETRCKKQLSLQEGNELDGAFSVSINYSNSIETSAGKLNDENLIA